MRNGSLRRSSIDDEGGNGDRRRRRQRSGSSVVNQAFSSPSSSMASASRARPPCRGCPPVAVPEQAKLHLLALHPDTRRRRSGQRRDHVDVEDLGPGQVSVSQPPIVGPIAGASVAVTPNMRQPDRLARRAAACRDDRKRHRDQHAAGEPLADAEEDHLGEAARGPAQHREDQEEQGVRDQVEAERERLREPAGERDHDDLGDEIGGRDPGALVRARPRARPGCRSSEALVIWMSSTAMKAPSTRPPDRDPVAERDLVRASAARGLLRRARRVGGWPGGACAVSTVATTESPGRSAPTIGSSAVERDLHRHALHDLGEIAGRVLGRQQRELRAGAGGEAVDRAAGTSCPGRRRPRASQAGPAPSGRAASP